MEEGEDDCRLNRVTSRFTNEVLVIAIVTAVSSIAVLVGSSFREAIERGLLGLLRWNLGAEAMDNPIKPLSYYWIYAAFTLTIFVLVIVLLRFILVGNKEKCS